MCVLRWLKQKILWILIQLLRHAMTIFRFLALASLLAIVVLRFAYSGAYEVTFTTVNLFINHPYFPYYYESSIWKKISDFPKRIDSICIKPYGRFGNNVIQVIHVLSIASYLDVRKIYVPDSFWFINESIYAGGYRFLKNEPPNSEIYLKHHFFPVYDPDFDYSEQEYYGILTVHLESVIRKVPINDSIIHLHIRSGDSFGDKPPSHYPQPPLCFYKGAINISKRKKCVIYSEDSVNPVINYLLKRGCELRTYDLLETVSHMYYSKYLAISYGTFTHSLLKICRVSKTVFVPELMVGGRFESNHNHFFKIIVNQLDINYVKIMFPWDKANDQLNFLMTSHCPLWYLRDEPIGQFKWPLFCDIPKKSRKITTTWVSVWKKKQNLTYLPI